MRTKNWSGIIKIENEPIARSEGTLFDVRTIHGVPEVKGMIVTDESTVGKILMFGTIGRVSRSRRSGVKAGIKEIGGESANEEIKEYHVHTLIGTIIKISDGELIKQILGNNYVLVKKLSQISFIRPGQPEQDERIV